MSYLSAARLPLRWARAFPRDLRFFVVGQIASQIGDQCYLVALSWLVAQRTGSPAALGMLLAAAAIPRALLMPFGGMLADRFGHRRVLLTVESMLALLSLLLVVLAVAGTYTLWPFALVAIMFGVLEGLLTPAAFSMVPRLVAPSMVGRGNSLLLGGLVLSGIIGPVLAGFLLQHGGAVLVFALDGFSYLVAVATLVMMAPMLVLATPVKWPTPLADVRTTLCSAWADRELARYLVLLLLGNLAVAGPLQVGVVALTRNTVGAGPQALGTALAVFAGGSLVGTCLAAALPQHDKRSRVVFAGILASSAVLAALGMVRTLPQLIAAVGALGVGIGLLDVVIQTGVQQRAQAAQLGRVMGLVLCVAKLLVPVSTFAAGQIAEHSVSGLFPVAGALWATTTLMVMAILGRAMPQAEREHATTFSTDRVQNEKGQTPDLAAINHPPQQL